ncbi:hypothetical protein MACH16_15840 [Marinomonas pontica]|uniref:Helix-hairpin-helix domain-containing protein n=1 Tax=Marinomonas pontica TaxID=264739 RepID=A0ABM8FCM0_9GAMM|nr:hypothetical protein MACH16_15840 [Marinomonas pontica]
MTNPRKRLSAEVAWLPGIGPKRVGEVLSILESSPADLLKLDCFSSVAETNLLVAAFIRLSFYNVDEIEVWILKIAQLFESLNFEDLMVTLNDDRVVSGFPEVSDLFSISAEIDKRRRYYRQSIVSVLNSMPPRKLVEAVTAVVESATNYGNDPGPILIADLIDSYEVDVQSILDNKEAKINSLVEKLRVAVDTNQPDSKLDLLVGHLVEIVKDWGIIAQPIQISAKSRGLDHHASYRVANLVRSLSIDIFNEYDKVDLTKRLIYMLNEVFMVVGEFAEQITEDINLLIEMQKKRRVNSSLESISDLCNDTIEKVENQPTTANLEAQKIINIAPQLLERLYDENYNAETIENSKDSIAVTLMHCAVVHASNTGDWKPCIEFLEHAVDFACSDDIKSSIKINLSEAIVQNKLYEELRPIKSAPNPRMINGTGTKLYGSTDRDQVSGSFITTYYFVILAIPILPISRYRVIPTDKGYRFLGKTHLRTLDKWHIAITLGLIAWLAISI